MRTFYYVFQFSHTSNRKTFGMVRIYEIKQNELCKVSEIDSIAVREHDFFDKMKDALLKDNIIDSNDIYDFSAL